MSILKGIVEDINQRESYIRRKNGKNAIYLRMSDYMGACSEILAKYPLPVHPVGMWHSHPHVLGVELHVMPLRVENILSCFSMESR